MTQIRSKTSGPGRPKDPEKRAAILAAAKRLFPQQGFEGTSMDAIANAAGVSKLTVYSHYTDKETLFVAAVRAQTEEQMPASLFELAQGDSTRERLRVIARAFFNLITSPQAIALHRLLTAGSGTSTKLAQMFWESGPQRIQHGLADFLQREHEAGRLRVDDVAVAGAQFFCLIKGDLHARLLCGCCGGPFMPDEIDAHIDATVEMFLRAYAR